MRTPSQLLALLAHSQRLPASSRALIILIVMGLWGLITHGTAAGTGDEPQYMMISHSLAFDHDLDLTSDYANPNNLALGGRLEAGPHARPGKDGRLRPVHDIGLPVLFAPYYALAYKVTEVIVQHVPAVWLVRAKLDFTVTLRHFLKKTGRENRVGCVKSVRVK